MIKAWKVAGLALLVSLVMTGAVWPVQCLEITGGGSDDAIVSLPVRDGTVIQLEFINSIYLAPVRETLIYETARGISIVMVESPSAGVFEYYGLETNETNTVRFYRHVGPIRLRSHDYQHHKLTVDGKVVHLKGLVEDGEPLTIDIRSRENCAAGPARGR